MKILTKKEVGNVEQIQFEWPKGERAGGFPTGPNQLKIRVLGSLRNITP